MKRRSRLIASLLLLVGCQTPPKNDCDEDCGSVVTPATPADVEPTAIDAQQSSAVVPSQTTSVVPAPTKTEPPKGGLREIFPYVRVDVQAGVVEFDATVPIDAHDARTPLVYLEVVACPPDTKEHESLVVTNARGRDIHAALLMIGLKSGAPGLWDWTGPALEAHPPTGDAVEVFAAWSQDGATHEAPIARWVVSLRDATTLANDGGHFVFAGSRMVTRGGVERYEAQGAGTLIGLTTFGGEMIAWSRMYHHDSGIADPQWIANAKAMPPRGTPVIVRIRKAE